MFWKPFCVFTFCFYTYTRSINCCYFTKLVIISIPFFLNCFSILLNYASSTETMPRQKSNNSNFCSQFEHLNSTPIATTAIRWVIRLKTHYFTVTSSWSWCHQSGIAGDCLYFSASCHHYVRRLHILWFGLSAPVASLCPFAFSFAKPHYYINFISYASNVNALHHLGQPRHD